jgi:hypothetical protein
MLPHDFNRRSSYGPEKANNGTTHAGETPQEVRVESGVVT